MNKAYRILSASLWLLTALFTTFSGQATGNLEASPFIRDNIATSNFEPLVGYEISEGHAFEKHVLQQNEFAGLGIRTRRHFAEHIENVIKKNCVVADLLIGNSQPELL